MSEPMRQPPRDPRLDARESASRPVDEDPLEELARILGEGAAHPVRPEHLVEVGRRANPGRVMPHQLSDLEVALFEELRSSVAPEERVRGDFEREVPAIIPQHPVDDHDIASLRAITATGESEAASVASVPATETGDGPDLADYYAYDDGVAAGSYDPAFAAARSGDLDVAFAEDVRRGGIGAAQRSPFSDFDTDQIAAAARESSPGPAEGGVTPHSRAEQDAALRLAREPSSVLPKLVAGLVAVVLAGGGAYAGWRSFLSPEARGPVLVQADGKPFKVLPDPTKAAAPADNEPTLKRDNAVSGSKIVSLQEDPVDQVQGRTPEGREVRVINPGAPRAASADQPHSVKTVVVRPDGSIVSDGTPPRPAGAMLAPTPASSAQPAATAVASAPAAGAPVVAAVPVVPVPGAPGATASVPPVEPAPAASPVAVPPTAALPVASVPLPQARPQAPAAAPVAAAPAVAPPSQIAPPAAAPAPLPVKTVTTTPVTPPKPAVPVKTVTTTSITPPPAGGAPLALGPVAPKLAAAQPAAPKPAAAAAAGAPVALTPAPTAAGGGEWVVQVSASKSDEDARRSLSDAQRRYGALAGRSGDVQRADLGAKGVFYRARFAAGSRDQAAALCSQVQAQGGQCMVVRR